MRIQIKRALRSSLPRLVMAFIPTIAYLVVVAVVLYRLPVPLYLKTAAAVPMTVYSILVYPNTRSLLRDRGRILLVIIGFIGIATALCYGIGALWIDHHGFNGAVWSIFARAIDRYGFATTRGNCYWTGGSSFIPSAEIYNHHPPGLTWTLALAFHIFGVTEYVARSVPILFTLCGSASLLVLFARRFGAPAASALFPVLLASPGFLYFGRMVNFEPVIMGIALMFYSWLLLEPRSNWITWGLLVLAIAAPLYGWGGTPFALGGAFAWAKRRLQLRTGRALAVTLLPLGVFALCILYNSDWGASLPAAVHRSLSWNGVVRQGLSEYGFAGWLRQVWRHGTTMMPWLLWLLLPLLPFMVLRKTASVILLYGSILPFIIMVPLMPHAVYVHDYHMMFVWLPAGVSFAHLVARFGRRTLPILGASLLILIPLREGLIKVAGMHARNTYALHQARTGLSVNAATNPEDKVAIINTEGDPTPILAYYLDRHYGVFRRLAPALQDSSWKYYTFLHNFRGVSEQERNTASQMIEVGETYVPTFARRKTMPPGSPDFNATPKN